MTQASQELTQAKVKTLLVDLQQDVADYQRLEGMLLQQRTLLIQHDSEGLQHLHQDQMPLLEILAQRAGTRHRLLSELGLTPDDKGMQKLLAKLPTPLAEKASGLWQELHTLLQHCQTNNDWNGRLLAGQMELIRSLLKLPDGYPELDV